MPLAESCDFYCLVESPSGIPPRRRQLLMWPHGKVTIHRDFIFAIGRRPQSNANKTILWFAENTRARVSVVELRKALGDIRSLPFRCSTSSVVPPLIISDAIKFRLYCESPLTDWVIPQSRSCTSQEAVRQSRDPLKLQPLFIWITMYRKSAKFYIFSPSIALQCSYWLSLRPVLAFMFHPPSFLKMPLQMSHLLINWPQAFHLLSFNL